MPLKVFQSVELKYPEVVVVACAMVIAGVDVPVATLRGAEAVTEVTVPDAGVPGTKFVPLNLNTCPLVGAVEKSTVMPLILATVGLGKVPERSPPNDVEVKTTLEGKVELAIFPELSSCGILLAPVPTSTAMVPDVVIVPPVRPVPAEILVTLPLPPPAPSLAMEAQAPELN